jgi:hypothetical protein
MPNPRHRRRRHASLRQVGRGAAAARAIPAEVSVTYCPRRNTTPSNSSDVIDRMAAAAGKPVRSMSDATSLPPDFRSAPATCASSPLSVTDDFCCDTGEGWPASSTPRDTSTPPRSASTSAGSITHAAQPSRIASSPPLASRRSASAETTQHSRPCDSTAILAVSIAPLRRGASITSTPLDMPLMIRFRRGN